MGALRRSNKIDKRTDFVYHGPDYQNFPACSLCLNYSPFLFYVTSFNAMDSLKGIVHPKMNIFCVECLPRESAHDKTAGRPFYDMECLFNSPEIVSLFRGYRYTNPYYSMYSGVDRIIITENAKISPSYKELMRNPFPKIVKMHKLAQLFDPVHRMRFERHSDVVAVFRALRAKHREILQFYEYASTAHLHDNYDVLANRSPLGVTRRVERRPPSDDSLSDVSSIVIALERNDLVHSEFSRVMAGTQELAESNINSQPVEPNISSQSLSSIRNNSNELMMAGTQELAESNINSQPVQPNISSQSLSSIRNNSNEVMMAGTQELAESNINSQPVQPNISSQSLSSIRDNSNEVIMAGTQESAESNINSQPVQPNISSQSLSSIRDNSNEVIMAGTQESAESNINSQPVQPNISSQSLSSIRDDSNEVMAGTKESAESNINSQPVQLNISSQSLSSIRDDSNEVMAGTKESAESNINSQPVQLNISSQSLSSMSGIPILSESIDDEVPAQMALAPIREPSVSSTSSSVNDITVRRRVVAPQRKGRVVYHDSQEAGPSGLQQQQQKGGNAEPNSKRRRTMQPPTNPSPSDFPLTLQGPKRYPRLHGG
uniref:Uncharacterized protein n=1 Tax=Anopheles atroparvus TaxID=41427 RepID=A0AAG5CPV2_ANOAO